MKETYYFAYGSNMNLDQMEYRCPAASVVEPVHLEGYRLTFCGRGKGSGVATILPEEGSRVEGVLWKITSECEKSLDFYEDQPAIPSDLYFMGIVEGCHQNGISSRSITDALKRTREEVGSQNKNHRKLESIR